MQTPQPTPASNLEALAREFFANHMEILYISRQCEERDKRVKRRKK